MFTEFLQNFGLVIDLHGRCLRDHETLLKASGVAKAGSSLHPTVAQASKECFVNKLMKEYLSIKKHWHIPPPTI